MKTFLAIYKGSAESRAATEWDALAEAERNERIQVGLSAWGEWAGKWADQIVDSGGPLGKTKFVDKQGIVDIKNGDTAYCIVRAESHDAAAQMFLNHPHFSIFPGDSVEIMECLPLPGQA